jgi:chromosomal replication initiator protein
MALGGLCIRVDCARGDKRGRKSVVVEAYHEDDQQILNASEDSAGDDGHAIALEQIVLEQDWQKVRALLRQSIGARSFDHWLKPVGLGGWTGDDQSVALTVPSGFMANWVQNQHADRLLQAWRAIRPEVRSIRLETDSERSDSRRAVPIGQMPAEAVSPIQPSQGPFDPRLTFQSFVKGDTNAVATNAANRFAGKDGGQFNPLFIHGSTGQGKTHLLHAIGHAFRAHRPEATILYMSAERFMFDFVSAMRAKDTLSFKARLRAADMLLIDDVQFIAGKESTQEEFLHTVDEVIGNGGRLAISADRGPHALAGVEGRILSRLTQGLVVDIKPADFALRRSILGAKAKANGAPVPEEVLDLLAVRINTNVRELEGALNRLVAYASLGDRAITSPFAEEVLADMFRASQRRITIDEIQKRVSEHFRIRQAEMVSARRAREVARPRQIAMYLAKQLTPRSLPEIGRRFGGRDHTTVIHAVRQIERLRGIDTDIDNDVRTLMRVLES